MKKSKSNIPLKAGLILTGVIFAVIMIGLIWTPYDPNAMSADKFSSPSLQHIFGTDNFGRDIFSRVMAGAGTTLLVALVTIIIGIVGGVTLGALTGYFGGLADDILMRLGDVLTAFPRVLLALVIISLVGPGKLVNVMLALGLVFIPGYTRITRTAYAGAREKNYVKCAQLMGASHSRILWVHILPNIISVLLPALTIGFNNAVLAEASMSYLGVGVMPPNASLGYMLSEAQGLFLRAPWYLLSAGMVIVLLVFGVGLIGEGLQRQNGEVF